MIAALALGLTLAAGDQNALNAARDLYASAAYEDALAVINRVPEASSPPDEARVLSQYRAFCLIALGRTSEADRAIEAMITRDPLYQPPANEMSPRMRAAFMDVRRRIMPTIIQQTYAQAKTAFDRKEYEAAASGFGRVLEVMSDPDLAAIYRQPPLADLRTLAGGFRDLAATAAAPPPPPAIVAASVAPPAAARMPEPPRVYSATDASVVPPQTLRQELPPYPGQLPMTKQGAIEVVIDESGAVESARMRQSITVPYDALAMKAAAGWRYVPATVEGKPVKYRKVVQITVNPKGPSR